MSGSEASSSTGRSFWSAIFGSSASKHTGSGSDSVTSGEKHKGVDLEWLPRSHPGQCDVQINLPLYGVVYIPSPPDAQGVPRPQRTTVTGEVEIRIPKGVGRRRCRGIRLIRRALCQLSVNEQRKDEIDVLYDKIQPLFSGETILEEGFTRIPFVHELEETIMSVDGRGQPHSLLLWLFAEVLGETTQPDDRPYFRLDNVDEAAPPAYDSESGSDSKLPMLEQTVTTWRLLVTKHNPSPDGTTCRLDNRFNAFVPDVGLIEARCFAKNFTVAGPVMAQLQIHTPAPTATIYAFRVSIQQTTNVTSPRDGFHREQVTETPFALIGKIPPVGPVALTTAIPALWRGADVGGTGKEECRHVIRSRFPHANDTRWTTLLPCDTPVLYSHMLVYEVFFTIYGQDRLGKAMSEPGPGHLRIVRRQAKIVLPNCSLTPALVRLPQYTLGDLDSGEAITYDEPCSSCGIAPLSIQCDTCEPGTFPHVRHDHPCAICRHASILPAAGAVDGIWPCECAALEKARQGAPDYAVDSQEFDDPDQTPTVRSERRDGMFAVKLDQEWRNKHDSGS